MEHWNFHNYIALPLEEYGKEFIGNSCKTADEIEGGEFVDAMFSVLLIKFGNLKAVSNFVALCENYTDMPASKIPTDIAKEIFEEFKKIVRSK